MEDSKLKETLDQAIQKSKEFAEDIHLKENLSNAASKTKEALGIVGEKIVELSKDEELKAKFKDVSTPIVDTGKKVVEKLEENQTFNKVVSTVKEGAIEAADYVSTKTQEFLEKPEVQEKLEQAKDKTIELAEAGVENLKKWLKPEASDEQEKSQE